MQYQKSCKSRIVDSHNHLHFNEFRSDLEQVVSRAVDAGVETMLLVGIDPQDSLNALNLARRYQGMYVSLGIHPQLAGSFTAEDVLKLNIMAGDHKVVAIGETGLDLYRAPDTLDLQKQLFKAHIGLARSLNLPLVIHSRDAHEIVLNIMDENDAWGVGGVIHCFSGDMKVAEHVINRGFMISIPGVVTFKNGAQLREIVKHVPGESILVETDAPYLAPVPHRGKRNEPAYVVDTLEAVSRVRGVGIDDMAAVTASNFSRLFLKDSDKGPLNIVDRNGG